MLSFILLLVLSSFILIDKYIDKIYKVLNKKNWPEEFLMYFRLCRCSVNFVPMLILLSTDWLVFMKGMFIQGKIRKFFGCSIFRKFSSGFHLYFCRLVCPAT